MNSELANWISVIGSILSLIGVAIAVWQIRKTRRSAEAAKEASEQTQQIISRNLLIDYVKTCLKNLDDIQKFVRDKKFEFAQFRTQDLLADLNQIEQRVKEMEHKIPFEFEEIFPQLIIIREEFEKKINKTSARIDRVRINTQLSKVSDDLNKLIGGSLMTIEVNKENE